MYHRPLGVKVGPFAMFHVLVAEPYFSNGAWLGIKGIVMLIMFFF
jgi:hypothetical protein